MLVCTDVILKIYIVLLYFCLAWLLTSWDHVENKYSHIKAALISIFILTTQQNNMGVLALSFSVLVQLFSEKKALLDQLYTICRAPNDKVSD